VSELTEAELVDIERRAAAATPGPWFARFFDEVNAMNLVAVSTAPDTGGHDRWPDFDHSTIVAATLVQEPRYADIADQLWDENAAFIAHARSDIPRLIAEIRRLRANEKGEDPLS
jgi:hypothetical protein